MRLLENVQQKITKLQQLPEQKKKIIFFVTTTVATLGLGFFVVQLTIRDLEKIHNTFPEVAFPIIDTPTPEFSFPQVVININDVSEGDGAVWNVTPGDGQIFPSE